MGLRFFAGVAIVAAAATIFASRRAKGSATALDETSDAATEPETSATLVEPRAASYEESPAAAI